MSASLSASSPPHFTADSPRVSIDFTDFCTVNSAGVIGFMVIKKKQQKTRQSKKKRPHGNLCFPSLGNPRTAAQTRKSEISYKEKEISETVLRNLAAGSAPCIKGARCLAHFKKQRVYF